MIAGSDHRVARQPLCVARRRETLTLARPTFPATAEVVHTQLVVAGWHCDRDPAGRPGLDSLAGPGSAVDRGLPQDCRLVHLALWTWD